MDQNNQKLLAYKFDNPFIPVNPTNPVSSLEKVLSSFIGFLSIVAIIWFTFQIIIASYNYISSQGDKGKIEQAQKSITNSVLGLIIALIAIFLASFIAKILGINNPFDLVGPFSKILIK